MKKIMIIAAVAMAAIATQAASFNWKTSTTGKVYEAGSTTATITGMAYLFDVTTVTQSALVEAFAAGSLNLSTKGSISSASVASGKIAQTPDFDYAAVAAGSTLNAYFAIVANVGGEDMLYISSQMPVVGIEGKANTATFNEKTFSQAAAMDASSGYSTAGWYQSVPEPTSGLLMLLGMAGLALRRRRA